MVIILVVCFVASRERLNAQFYASRDNGDVVNDARDSTNGKRRSPCPLLSPPPLPQIKPRIF